jgi:hypothetical protein
MKNLFFLVITLFIMFSINTSCKKKVAGDCWTPDTAYYDFNIAEVGKIPYKGFDTLKFKNEATGIVYTFIGQGIDTSLTYSQRWFPDMCPEEFQKCQSQKFKYVAPNFQYPIIIQAFMPDGNRSSADLNIQFEGVNYSKDLGTVGFASYTDTINGQVYNNISDIRYYDDHTQYNHVKYSVYDGILQVVFRNKIYSKQK